MKEEEEPSSKLETTRLVNQISSLNFMAFNIIIIIKDLYNY
jgi:hypothetical protein